MGEDGIQADLEEIRRLSSLVKEHEKFDADLKLHLKDVMFRIEHAPGKHQSPIVPEDLTECDRWLSEVNAYRGTLQERFLAAISKINLTNMQNGMMSAAVGVHCSYMAEELRNAAPEAAKENALPDIMTIMRKANQLDQLNSSQDGFVEYGV